MSQSPISRSPDLGRLRDEGYDIEIRSSSLLVRGVPYVNARREVKRGILVSTLNLAGDVAARPDDHTVRFTGEYPCHSDGTPMSEVVNQSKTTPLDEKLVVHHSFSQKPKRGHYVDYFEKMTTYAAILTSHAQAIDPSATPRTYRVDEPDDDDSPFEYVDTASGRAEITALTRALARENVGIIGLGGSGAYVLDFVAKTPVRKIHAFDGDKMSTHNAFRSPGAATLEELRAQPRKASYFRDKYSKIHKGIIAHDYYIDDSNVEVLRGMDFVFVCIDRGAGRRLIVAKLEEFGVPFVDVGMGIYMKDSGLGGTVRVSTGAPGKHDATHNRIPVAEFDGDNEYETNIQVADLNALNAALAVIRWKKTSGFYLDLENEHFSAYTIESNLFVSEDCE